MPFNDRYGFQLLAVCAFAAPPARDAAIIAPVFLKRATAFLIPIYLRRYELVPIDS